MEAESRDHDENKRAVSSVIRQEKSKGKEKKDIGAGIRERKTKRAETDVFRTSKSGLNVDAQGELPEY